MIDVRLGGTTNGYTRIVARAGEPRDVTRDLLLSDDGVLYLATDAGNGWLCLGLVDPEELLDDLGLLDGSAADLVAEDVPRAVFGPAAL